MLKKIALLIVLFTTPMILAQEATQHQFVGAKACGMCHKSEKQGKQLSIWESSAHAKAYETLKTARADSIAKAKGISTKAVVAEACLKCHVSGYNVDASLLDKKFNMEDGVQCETCHGAGADYKSLKVMKVKADAVANGLMIYDKVETLCVKCHNSESPTFDAATFNAEEMWAKIKHAIPAK
jgi:mono/diheme cytochrome c family protein